MSRILGAWSLAVVAAFAGAAHAEDSASPANTVRRVGAVHRSPHTEETANIVGLKGGAVARFKQGEAFGGGSVIPFYEHTLIPGWLELEVTMPVTFIDDEKEVAFEALAKKPLHVNERVDSYVAVGPNLTIIKAPEETRVRGGVLASVGSYFWFGDRRWGIDAELVYLLLFDTDLTHELSAEIGPVFRF